MSLFSINNLTWLRWAELIEALRSGRIRLEGAGKEWEQYITEIARDKGLGLNTINKITKIENGLENGPIAQHRKTTGEGEEVEEEYNSIKIY